MIHREPKSNPFNGIDYFLHPLHRYPTKEISIYFSQTSILAAATALATRYAVKQTNTVLIIHGNISCRRLFITTGIWPQQKNIVSLGFNISKMQKIMMHQPGLIHSN